MCKLAAFLTLLLILFASPTFAWGPKGHQAVGAIADANLSPHAKSMVASLIGMSLEQAGPWLDCVKDVKGSKGSLHYVEDSRYADGCAVFWDHEGPSEKAIEAYADKNWDNCSGGSDANPCHSQYHFADVDVSAAHPVYSLGEAGTNDHDVVQAINAALKVLQDQPPSPFMGAMDKREALLMLAHLVGDLHQPLHVGAIYLEQDGDETHATSGDDADPGFTRGGNWMFAGSKNVHSIWDSVSAATVKKAKAIPTSTIPTTSGALADWPVTWANETIGVAKARLEELHIAPEAGAHHWPIGVSAATYQRKVAATQVQQVAIAGHHFAALLNALWP
jgi:hypothetical protein